MKTPIVIDENGDLSVFETIEHAQQSLEPVDVRNMEYVAYDRDGILLSLEVRGPDGRVFIEDGDPRADHSDELRKALLTFFARTGNELRQSASTSLGEVIDCFVQRYGYTR